VRPAAVDGAPEALLATLQALMVLGSQGSNDTDEHTLATISASGIASAHAVDGLPELARFAAFAPHVVRLFAAAETTDALVRGGACLYSLHCVAGAPLAAVPDGFSTQNADDGVSGVALRPRDCRQSALWLVAANAGAVGKMINLAASLVDAAQAGVVQSSSGSRGHSQAAADEAPGNGGDDDTACWSAIC
jgi:hypothetical protein